MPLSSDVLTCTVSSRVSVPLGARLPTAGVQVKLPLPSMLKFAASSVETNVTRSIGSEPLSTTPVASRSPSLLIVTDKSGSTTVTSNGFELIGGCGFETSAVTVFVSVGVPANGSWLLGTSLTNACTSSTNELLVALPSVATLIAPNVNATSSPSNVPPETLGTGTLPLKSAASNPFELAALVISVHESYCKPSGNRSVRIRSVEFPSDIVTSSAKQSSSPIVTLLPIVLGSEESNSDFVTLTLVGVTLIVSVFDATENELPSPTEKSNVVYGEPFSLSSGRKTSKPALMSATAITSLVLTSVPLSSSVPSAGSESIRTSVSTSPPTSKNGKSLAENVKSVSSGVVTAASAPVGE